MLASVLCRVAAVVRRVRNQALSHAGIHRKARRVQGQTLVVGGPPPGAVERSVGRYRKDQAAPARRCHGLDWRMLTDEQRSWFVDPYLPCATECVRLASARAMVACDSLQHCFARSPALVGKTTKLLEAQAEEGTLASLFIDSFEVQEMRFCPALQAADLWAYETHKAAPMLATRFANLRYPMARLLNMDPSAYVSYFDANVIRVQCAAFSAT